MKILISISDRSLSKAIAIYFNRLNIENDIANDGIQSLEKLTNNKFDYLLVEDDIVRLNAKELLEKLKNKNIDIFSICIKNKAHINYKDLIDNDFDLIIPKPFDIKDVLEIIKADNKNLNSNDLAIAYETRCIKFIDKEIHTNLLELKIMDYMIQNKKIVVDDLYSIIKGKNYNLISNYIESLNYKLKKINYPYNIKPIEKGYELVIL